MAYLGRAVDSGAISNIENLDNITFDGSSSYSLTKNSVAFVPASASNLLISIDGVVNATNFTVSGSTVDFGVAVSSSSVCNFIIHLGVGIVTTPSDGSVGTSQLASTAVTTAKIADDAVTKDKLLSHNYPAFEAYLSADQSVSDNTETKVAVNTEIFDTDNCYDNTTNYRFTPNVAGKYFVYCQIQTDGGSGTNLNGSYIYLRKNGSNHARMNFDFYNNQIRGAITTIYATIDMNGSSDYLELFGKVDSISGSGQEFIGDSSREKATRFGAYRIGD